MAVGKQAHINIWPTRKRIRNCRLLGWRYQGSKIFIHESKKYYGFFTSEGFKRYEYNGKNNFSDVDTDLRLD